MPRTTSPPPIAPGLWVIPTSTSSRRDVIGATEQIAAEPLIEAVGGDRDRALALLGLAHGLVDLELSGHFPAGTDIDAIWRAGVNCLAAAASPAPGPSVNDQDESVTE